MLKHVNNIKNRLELSHIHSIYVETEISKVFSANARWIPRAYMKNGRPLAYLQLAPEAEELKSEVSATFSTYKVPDDIKSRARALVVEAELHLPEEKVMLKDGKSLRKSDLSNMWQVIENGLVEGLNLDDSLTTELYIEKAVSKNSLHYLILKIEVYGVL